MKKPLFYKNKDDDNHCLQATILMVLNTSGIRVSWEDVEKMTDYEEGLYSWVPRTILSLDSKISGAKLIDPMNYQEFAKRGEQYLKEYMSPEWFELQKNHASQNFLKEQKSTQELILKNLVEQRTVVLSEIEELLDNNYLIALLDTGIVQGKSWHSGHFVLLYEQDGPNFYMHDPGLPPKPAICVNKKLLIKAFQNVLIVVPRKTD